MTATTRRRFMKGLLLVPAAGFAVSLPRPARAADITLKFGNNLPASHPLNIRANEAAERIARETDGRIKVDVFPNNQLGGDTDMLSQVRSGGIDIFNAGTLVIATLAPISAITGVGFAFANYDQVWGAVDGPLGNLIRAAFAKVGLHTFEKMWDNGFRQITTSNRAISSPADLARLKIRVPVSPMGIALFQALGASPTSLQFSEVYSALQTKVVDAQENPLAIVETAKLYEVQKFCSLTNHSWDGYHMVFNGRSWRSLPDNDKTIVSRAFNEAGLQQRADLRKLSETLRAQLTAKGLAFNETQPEGFQAKLREAGFYQEWQGRFGNEAWSVLEGTVGRLA